MTIWVETLHVDWMSTVQRDGRKGLIGTVRWSEDNKRDRDDVKNKKIQVLEYDGKEDLEWN